MRLKDVLVDSLKPHLSQLSSWHKQELEILFLGFGNLLIITPSGQRFEQTFYDNAVDICLALDELGFSEMDFSARDFYWIIHAQPAKIRSDLFKSICANGNQVLGCEEETDFEVWDFEDGINFESEEE